MKAALFITCLADTLFPKVGQATVTLLERLGVEVSFPSTQTCCGQMHINTGYQRGALPLIRNFVDTFEAYEHTARPPQPELSIWKGNSSTFSAVICCLVERSLMVPESGSS